MPIQFDPKVSSGSRVQVRQTQAPDGSGPVFRLSEPGKGARFGRGTLNLLSHLFCFIPGVKYTKNTYNPKQWAAFRNAILATHAQDLKPPQGSLTEGKLDLILSTYSPHKRLTQGKAAAVLADVQRAARGESLAPRKTDRLNASQVAPARGLRSLWVLMSGRNAGERALREAATRSDEPTAAAVRDILRPGRTMSNLSVKAGQEALERHAVKRGANFAWSAKGMEAMSLKSRLNLVAQTERSKIAELRQAAIAQPDKPALLSIPVILFPRALGFHEQHVVELAVDFRQGKLLYLDSKGESIEEASRNYDSGDVAQALTDFGRQVFADQSWSPETGIVQMTQAKQQGANDCGAFTHDFTRRLIEGQSVGDIERSFDAIDRRMLRVNMASDIAGSEEPAAVVESPQQPAPSQATGHSSEPGEDEFFDVRRDFPGQPV